MIQKQQECQAKPIQMCRSEWRAAIEPAIPVSYLSSMSRLSSSSLSHSRKKSYVISTIASGRHLKFYTISQCIWKVNVAHICTLMTERDAKYELHIIYVRYAKECTLGNISSISFSYLRTSKSNADSPLHIPLVRL